MKTRFESQRKRFEKEASKTNFADWKIYEAWLFGHGRKLPTVLKLLGVFKRIHKLFPTDDLKSLSKNQMIEINYRIVASDYKITTKITMQLFIRSYLTMFSTTEDRKKEIKDIIKILQEPNDGDPDRDEVGKVISYKDFQKIYRNIPTEEMKMMVKVLFATGMRVTELYNIIPEKIQFVKKNIGPVILPPGIFGYKGAWIYTRGKRTKSKIDGRYLYFMCFFVDELKKYTDKFNPGVYIFNFSYSYFLGKLHESVKNENLPYVVHPHLFRHTVATRLFKKKSDSVVKYLMNWAKDSDMPKKYSHIRKADILEAMNDIKMR